MILSLRKFENSGILGPIIKEHPECFHVQGRKDWETMTMALGLFYHVSLGKESLWYPYMRLLLDKPFEEEWQEKELEML